MVKKYTAIFIFLLVLLHGHGYGEEIKKSVPDYFTLVKQLKNNDRSIDFTALRYSYTKTKEYNPYGGDDTDKDVMYKALNNNEFAEAAKHAQAVLDKNYVDMDAHFVCKIAFRETKNTDKQDYHAFVLKGLLASIYASGNGQTAETAFVVINTREEYFFLKMYGYNVIKSSLVKINDRSYDKMDTEERKTGEKIVFYFNVDMPFNWLSSQMENKKP